MSKFLCFALLFCATPLLADELNQTASLAQAPRVVEDVLARKDVHAAKRYVTIRLKDGKKRRGYLDPVAGDASVLVLRNQPATIPLAEIATIRVRKDTPKALYAALYGSTGALVLSIATLNEPGIVISTLALGGTIVVGFVDIILRKHYTITLVS